MKQEFVPYAESLQLKELGFDEECIGAYFHNQIENEALKDVLKHKNKKENKMAEGLTAREFLDDLGFTTEGGPNPTISEAIRAMEQYANYRVMQALNSVSSIETSIVTRVEVIDHSESAYPLPGRAWGKYGCKEVELQLQDDDRTLKIFIK